MTLLSLPALYDGKAIHLLGDAPVNAPYRVVVTFVAPLTSPVTPDTDLADFWSSFGAWHEDGPTDDLLEAIRSSRRSKAEPPAL
ncbi:MAG: hypothetical protein H7Y32_03470 [Chloroflexales bacterium]|nr:hypothetical protein [Chloroflexales bacterium]